MARAKITAMSIVTRFAPSPTGQLHLGNARTALFSWLLARQAAGRFILRIEDTDAERSREDYRLSQLEDLEWLGLAWDAGPGREDGHGPYLQSQRTSLYEQHLASLQRQGRVYECFCSALELEVSRKSQLAAGRPPRYAGTCRELSAEQRAARRAQGLVPTLRFRVPSEGKVQFTDLVHGFHAFATADIGDFIVRRADGSPAFFFSNAVDDALMGVTQVVRGDDHLSNTPRQILILEALGLPVPVYGHLSLLVGRDGAPLSKRHGATTVGEYRARGFTAQALCNHLFRLGHSTPEHGLLDAEAMAQAFDVNHLGRSPAHFEETQLRTWQKESVQRLSPGQVRDWLAAVIPAGTLEAQAVAFAEAIRGNVVLPEDAQAWVTIVFGGLPEITPEAAAAVGEAGPVFFAAAARAAAENGRDLAALTAAARAATGRKGAQLYMPLRGALTGLTHGPELAPLLKALPEGEAQARLARFA